MRKYLVAGTIMTLALVATGSAQDPNAQQFFQTFNGVNPRNVSLQVPAATSRTMRSMNVRAMQPATKAGTTTLNTSSFFRPNLAVGTWPPKVPNVFILKNSPYQPNPPKGNSMLDLLYKWNDKKK